VNNFSEFGLAGPVLKALADTGYDAPTPIQVEALPPVMNGHDLLGIAQTGTGKTAAFALPILHRLATDNQTRRPKSCRVLVLSPTRELASQIADSFRTYAKHMRISITTVFGGVGYGGQTRALARGVDVLVATPGRLEDHLKSGNVRLGTTEVLVLDEADHMLDLGFVKPVRNIVSHLPKTRQTLLFSATMPKPIAELAKEFLHNPERVSVAPVSSTAERVSQRVLHVDGGEKRARVVQLIRDEGMTRTLVFTRTKRGADRVTKYLEGEGIDAAAIHGNKSQGQRERALSAFKSSKIAVLVATDIAARGIDVDDVTHVINYELPEVAEVYVHRIGRTARAGAEGSAVSLCDGSEVGLLRGIERLIRQKIPSDWNPASDDLSAEFAPRPKRNQKRRAQPDRAGRAPKKANDSPARAESAAGSRRRNKPKPEVAIAGDGRSRPATAEGNANAATAKRARKPDGRKARQAERAGAEADAATGRKQAAAPKKNNNGWKAKGRKPGGSSNGSEPRRKTAHRKGDANGNGPRRRASSAPHAVAG